MALVRAARKSKLTPAQIARILRLSGRLPQWRIALQFGVTQAYVCKILRKAGVRRGSGRVNYYKKGGQSA